MSTPSPVNTAPKAMTAQGPELTPVKARHVWPSEAVVHCVFLALLTYAAHYWYCARYGIYEDDFAIVPYASFWTIGQVCSWAKMHWMQFTHGRPLGWTTWVLVPWLGFKLGGSLHAVYLLASTIVMANTVLFYLLVRRSFGQPSSLALIAGVAYCLFPADTARQMLVHTSMLQPSVLFMLIGSHFYLSRRPVPAYAFALASFICYEVGFLPFLCMPLLVRDPTERWRGIVRRLALHGLICSLLVGSIAVLRIARGEAQMKVATDQGVGGLFYRIATSLYVGPYTAVSQLFVRAVAPFSVQGRSLHVLNAMIVAFLALLAVFVFVFSGKEEGEAPPPIRTRFRSLLQPFVAGIAMLVGGYLLAFTPDHFPPVDVCGRMSGIHLAAALGASLVVACVAQALVLLLRANRMGWIAAPILAAYFATLVGFAFIVQKNFVIAHDGPGGQREYWTRLVKLCPDLHDGTMVLIEGTWPSNNWYALPRSWSDPLALMEMYDYPSGMSNRPLIVPVPADRSWTGNFKRHGDRRFVWTKELPSYISRLAGNPLHYVARSPNLEMEENDLILLRAEAGRLERVEADVVVDGSIVHFRPAPSDRGLPYPPGTLYPLLVMDGQLPPVMRHSSISGPFANSK